MELREQAVFALSQMEHVDTLPVLFKVARNEREPQLQQAALMALAEYDTPEVIALYEELLLGD